MSVELTQFEADHFFRMEKKRANGNINSYPATGQKICVDLLSIDERELFFLDIVRGSASIEKITKQNRARTTVILCRIDVGGSPHMNPDGQIIDCPHMHLYREGFSDKWAFPIPPIFRDLSNPALFLEDFMRYCNIVDPPEFQYTML